MLFTIAPDDDAVMCAIDNAVESQAGLMLPLTFQLTPSARQNASSSTAAGCVR